MIQEHTLPPPAGLLHCDSVVDVGAGIRPMQWYQPRRHICIEPFGPYADALERAGYLTMRGRAVSMLPYVSADAVYLLDVIEHMEREEGAAVIQLARVSARRQVVVYTPWGYVEQTRDVWGMGGEFWQTHRSGWTPDDFPGWAVEFYRPDGGTTEGFYAVLTLGKGEP